jgi:trigger factor
MQVTETLSDGLRRAFQVVVPAGDLQAQLDARLEEIRPRVQLKGFRPGKVPASHIRKLYGPSLIRDIIDAEVQQATQKALGEGKLRPAADPAFIMESDLAKVIDGGADLAFKFEVELIPDFKPADVSTITVEKVVAAVTETQVAAMLKTIADSSKTFDDKDGAAEIGDSLTIDFLGKIDGEAFDGGSAEGATVVIGANRFIPGFEEQLVGASMGDARVLKVTFPEDYPVDTLKGKAATFDVTVHAVRAPNDREIDDAFAGTLGFETLESLKEVIKSQIEQEHNAQTRAKLKRALFDQLETMHDLPLPQGMVNQEFEQIWRQVTADKEGGRLDSADAAKSEDDLKADYRKIAERRVKLGLVLAEIGRAAGIQVSDQEVSQAVAQQARQFPGRERQLFEFYQKNPQALAQVRAPIYEEKTVDYILELATVTVKDVDRDTLFADDEE